MKVHKNITMYINQPSLNHYKDTKQQNNIMIMQFNSWIWLDRIALSLTKKKNNKIKSITLPGLCSLLEQSENG